MNVNAKLKNTAELKRVLPLTVAAYRDYRHYWGELGLLAEDFDESLEHFDSTTWYNMILARKETDDYAMNCITALNESIRAFDEIMEQAAEGLTILLKAILSLPPEKQIQVFERAFKIEPQQLDEVIEQMFEAFDEVEYRYAVPENYEDFLKLIDEVWEEYNVAI
jgi:tetratricopeptide (TPR) repeat protein